jgi:glycosyltransferase involved in cell wall biosynthesis
MTVATLYDASYLMSRLGCRAPDGFTNVDFAYGRYFSQASQSSFVHYGKDKPNVLGRGRAQQIINLLANARWSQGTKSESAIFNELRRAILDQNPAQGVGRIRGDSRSQLVDELDRHHIRLRSMRLRLPSSRYRPIPEGAVYLNVAQYKIETRETFSWLDRRLDVRPVFFLHDLLPLDYPEFFPAGEYDRFDQRVETASRYGRGLIFASQSVRDRVEDEFARRKRPFVPHVVAPLPSPLSSLEAFGGVDPSAWADSVLATTPYFVMVSTIEPRKNHLLMVSVWRQLAEKVERAGGVMPKLVIVGRRGHGSQQVFDVLDRSHMVRRHVIEVAGLSSANLSRLIANANALLMPSFAEGYGLPMVEALTLGTPVVATDDRVFREVTQGKACYLSAVDGAGWLDAVQNLADPSTPSAREARARARTFVSPNWAGYFDDILHFLKSV